MDYRAHLAANLASESEAYGYTLTIWGSGALLIHAYSVPDVARISAFVAGALVGFGVLAGLAFQGFTAEMAVGDSPSSLVVSAIHVLSTGGALAAVSLLLELTQGGPPLAIFFAVGALATVAYNSFLLLEAVATRALT